MSIGAYVNSFDRDVLAKLTEKTCEASLRNSHKIVSAYTISLFLGKVNLVKNTCEKKTNQTKSIKYNYLIITVDVTYLLTHWGKWLFISCVRFKQRLLVRGLKRYIFVLQLFIEI